ncbi:MAG: hypothetical protein HN742_26985 [Lentisphaerae bacterium]|jgi:tetratricopeptide (TPR) repeat protein|nr:hypothetical protein [Lentisphaerota bacterium]MBT4814382.1 hypothetical protein [Lentisphaerota bacterium]MBT5608930.1 hypothetical protein [Lentisphaerota bacterium]MBT7055589.1 hypothetical protein [Lentisphaerota bacterium]MBT7845548.1 hypothetical protein [Lentisphaerota bacterium]
MRLVIGIVMLMAGALAVAMAGAFGVLAAVPLGIIAGMCLYPYVAAPFGRAAAGMVVPGRCREMPEQFTRARSLIARHSYDEAIAELETMLAARPELAAGWSLLAEIHYENRDDPDHALGVALKGLAAPAWVAEHEPLTLLAVDIYLERGEKEAAVSLLRKQLKRANGASGLQKRLAHLESQE